MARKEPLTTNALLDLYFDLPEDRQGKFLIALVHDDRSREKLLDIFQRFIWEHDDPESLAVELEKLGRELAKLRQRQAKWGRPDSSETARLRAQLIEKHKETGWGAKKLANHFRRSRSWAQGILQSFRENGEEGAS